MVTLAGMTARPNATGSHGDDDRQAFEALLPAPNHHADHPGFSGVSGLIAAVGFLFGRERAAQLAIDLAAVQTGERLVDVGCGAGIAARRANRVGAAVIGVDPSSAMLRVARARWRRASGIEWRMGAAESLPVADAWAQVVWSLATVHHWHDVDAAVVEAQRVLAPGGRLVVLERRIEDTEAEGTASHGWTTAQRDSFAEYSRRHGFVDVIAGEHTGDPTLLSVVARRPAAPSR
jgi:SAM-dependent methyltransferase